MLREQEMSSIPSKQSKIPFRHDIQGLRAVSVLLVILFHAGITGFDAGYLGVDIFFVISGYWMTMLIMRDLEQGTFRFRDFYARRIRRILPALYFSLLLTLVIAWFVLWPQDFRDFMKVLGSTVLLFSNNVLWILGDGYFAPEMEYQPLLHMWSLSVEEQFYLFFPLFLFLTGFLWKGLRYALALLVTVASFGWAIWFFSASADGPSYVFYQLPGRIWEFAVGGMAAWWVMNEKPVFSWLGYLGVSMILFVLVMHEPTDQGAGIGMLLVVLGAVFLLLPGTATGRFMPSQVLALPVLVWVGGVSFSLYLVHQPILAFARHFGEINPLILLLLSLGGGLPLAGMMNKYIEDPFRNPDRIQRSQLIAGMSVSTIVLVGIAIYAVENKGLPDRFDALTTQITETAWGSPLRKKCHDVDPGEACVHFGDIKPTWVILGDSHVPALAYALGKRLQKDERSFLHLSVSGCGLASEDERCAKWYSSAIERVMGDDNLKYVVLSSRFASQMYGKHQDVWPNIPRKKSDRERDRIKEAYTGMIDAFVGKGKKVLWVQQAPEVGLNLSAVMRQAIAQQGNAVSVPKGWWEKRTAGFEEYFSQLKSRVVFINPADIFCDNSDCYAVKDGVSLYRDRDHMSLSAAYKIVEKMDDMQLFMRW